MAASLIDDNWKFGSDDETLFKLIKGQIPEQTMPTVYNTLPDEQVWQILAFIRTLYIGDPGEEELVDAGGTTCRGVATSSSPARQGSRQPS